MSFTEEQIAQLTAKLDPRHVKERKQGGAQVSYIEGWHAIAEANRIFGFGAWERETVDIRLVAEGERKIGRPPHQSDGHGCTYIAKVRVRVWDGERWITREGCGAGHGVDRDLGQAHESAIKEAETDAMKRALMTFGNPFGLALYDKDKREVGNGGTKPPPKPNGATRPEDFWKRDSYAIPFKGDWQKWDGSMRKAIDAAPSAETLNKLWNDNLEQREGLKAENARAHALLDEHFQKRWHALAQAPEREVA